MNQIEALFARYFEPWGITLPPGAVARRAPGELEADGWWVRYVFGVDEDGDYLDFYACHRLTNDRHERIYAAGETRGLPTAWDMVVYPAEASDQERAAIDRQTLDHNAGVSAAVERTFGSRSGDAAPRGGRDEDDR